MKHLLLPPRFVSRVENKTKNDFLWQSWWDMFWLCLTRVWHTRSTGGPRGPVPDAGTQKLIKILDLELSFLINCTKNSQTIFHCSSSILIFQTWLIRMKGRLVFVRHLCSAIWILDMLYMNLNLQLKLGPGADCRREDHISPKLPQPSTLHVLLDKKKCVPCRENIFHHARKLTQNLILIYGFLQLEIQCLHHVPNLWSPPLESGKSDLTSLFIQIWLQPVLKLCTMKYQYCHCRPEQ